MLCDREKKKKGGKADEKKRKSVGEKERDKVVNESFKSKEFISSEESSSDSDRGKGKKRKVTYTAVVLCSLIIILELFFLVETGSYVLLFFTG